MTATGTRNREDAIHGDALDSFLDKWRQRWPEWGVAEVFLPAAQRTTAVAWAALLQELADAAWGGPDPRPGEAKLVWWSEELRGWSQGARRHPLGIALHRLPVEWETLARALPVLQASRERPGDLAEAFALLEPFAAAAARIEERLFEERLFEGAAGTVDASRDVIAASLLQARFFHQGDGHVPLAVFARAGEGEPLAIWADQLRQRWPRVPAATLPRRLWAGLARARLGQADPVRSLKPWTALAIAWRAARTRN